MIPVLDVTVSPTPAGGSRIEITIDLPARLSTKIAALLLLVASRLQGAALARAITVDVNTRKGFHS